MLALKRKTPRAGKLPVSQLPVGGEWRREARKEVSSMAAGHMMGSGALEKE